MSKANWLGCIFAMIQQMTEIKRLGAFLVWRKERDGGEICLIQLTSLKRKIVPRGLYKRGTIVCTAPGSLQWWQGWWMPCDLNLSSPPSPLWWCTLDQRPLTYRGVSHSPGEVIQQVWDEAQECSFHKGSKWFHFPSGWSTTLWKILEVWIHKQRVFFFFFFNTPPPRVFFFVEVVVVVIYPVVFLTPKLYNHVHIFSRMFLYFRSWTPCVIWNI